MRTFAMVMTFGVCAFAASFAFMVVLVHGLAALLGG